MTVAEMPVWEWESDSIRPEEVRHGDLLDVGIGPLRVDQTYRPYVSEAWIFSGFVVAGPEEGQRHSIDALPSEHVRKYRQEYTTRRYVQVHAS